jgi:heat shock protein HslJ
MEQETLQVCPRCRMTTVKEGSFCPVCSTNTEVIAKNDSFEDEDKTVRAKARLSSRLYLKAVQQSFPEPVTQEAPQQKVPSTQPLVRTKRHFKKKSGLNSACGVAIVLLLFLLITDITGTNGTVQAQKQAEQAKEQLDSQLWTIQGMGVPASFLSSLFKQEQQIDSAPGVLTAFHNQFVEAYYQHQAQQYRALLTQISGIVKNATIQLQAQAQGDMQNLQTALARVGTLGTGNMQMFATHVTQEQLAFSIAHQASDYVAISTDARASIAGLNEMAAAFQLLNDLATAINNMKMGHLSVASVQASYKSDMQLFTSATQMSDFQHLSEQITAQDQQIVVASIRAFPYISAARLNDFQAQIGQLQKYGGNSKPDLARLSADQVSMASARTAADDLAFFQNIDADIAALHGPLVRSQARYQMRQFHSEVETWGKAHLYYDSYDGHYYMPDNGYMSAGVGHLLDSDLASAQTTDDFENVVAEVNNALFNLHMFERDYKDPTGYMRVHASDLQMISHYALRKRQVLIVSLAEQAMRVYQNGKLVKSFMVTTGRQELPSIPGVWSVLARRSPIIFTSDEPRNSPYWFPDTPIQYAMLYHLGGYFIHDAPWRLAFGPGTQYPHSDPIGTSAYNFDGSHGCVNLQENAAAWVYTHTGWNTAIVIY